MIRPKKIQHYKNYKESEMPIYKHTTKHTRRQWLCTSTNQHMLSYVWG